ncbi:MAG: hypothetical protein JW861_04580 [Bacteroidales bacterium]|nr:hypothetical protein [Bacteroidales bacterium]
MKITSLMITVLFCVCVGQIKSHPDTCTLEASLSGQLIRCQASGNGNSTHYLKPLRFQVTNQTIQPLTVALSSGTLFDSSDEAKQNLVVTRSEWITLLPDKSHELELYAMCTEMSDASPSEGVEYHFSGMAGENLLAVVRLIEEKGYHSVEGQMAVWAITDGASISRIAGFDTTAMNDLQQLVSRLTGQPVPPRNQGDYMTDYYTPQYQIRVRGYVEFYVPRRSSVHLAMFDENGCVVRELLKEPLVDKGEYEFRFEFDATVYTDPRYWIKLIMDDDVVLTRVLELDR